MSRSLPVVVLDDPTEPLAAPDLAWPDRPGASWRWAAHRRGEVQGHVRPFPVVVVNVLGQEMVEIARAQDDEVVEAFDLDALDEAGWHRTCHGSRFLGDLCGVSEPMFHTSSDKDEHAYTYDAVGNLTDLAATKYRGMTTALTHRRLVYDAFGRLVRVAAVDGMDETDVALYRYNGLNMRLMWHDDADADSTLESGERFYIMHDERWRPVATFRDADAAPKEAFVWHAAGQGGFGGSSYIDSIILRDRDNYTGGTPNPMTSASDGTLEERRYFCQNWRADVVAVTKSDGTPLEYVRYSPYGEPTVYPVADLNMDGVVNSADSSLWSDLLYSTSNASVYADTDLDFDGLDDWNSGGADGDLFYENYNENLGLSGVGRVSSPGVDNRTGYAGYQWDQTISANHVRYRVYLPDLGRWTRRDPLGYVDGMGLYEYCRAASVNLLDPFGLVWVRAPLPTSPPLRFVPAPPTAAPPGTGALGPAALCIQVGYLFFCIGYDIGMCLPDLPPVNFPPMIPDIPRRPPAQPDGSDWCNSVQAQNVWTTIGTLSGMFCHTGDCFSRDDERACHKATAWRMCHETRLAEEAFVRLCPAYAREDRGRNGSEAAKLKQRQCQDMCDDFIRRLTRRKGREY